MDILKQLAPLYRKHEDISLQDMDESDFFYTDHTLHFSSESVSYSELASSLTSSMKLDINRRETVSQERFEEEVDSLFKQVPQPPFRSIVTGAYACITDIPPILMCDNETTMLFEELLYGTKTVDELVNTDTTVLLERFLYMRPELICNSFVNSIRALHDDIPSFEVTPRCTLFAQSKLSLFEVYTISFTLINHSSSQQVVRIEPIPSVEDVHFSITVSGQEVVIKRGKSAVVDVSIQFTQRSTKLSKIILFSSDSTRDFVHISATSKAKVFGINPVFLPAVKDGGVTVPKILFLLKKRFLELKGECVKGVFRVSCSKEEGERVARLIDESGDRAHESENVAVNDVHVLAFLIKYFYRSMPTLILNTIDVSTMKTCLEYKDCQPYLDALNQSSRDLLMWFVSLMARVSSNCASTSMNENACARILAPNVFTVEDIVEYNRMLPIVTSFCEVLIVHAAKQH